MGNFFLKNATINKLIKYILMYIPSFEIGVNKYSNAFPFLIFFTENKNIFTFFLYFEWIPAMCFYAV